MKLTKLVTAVTVASLILVAGCYDNSTEYPDVEYYDGLVSSGWEAFEAGDYKMAMEHFQAAVDADCTKPDAYLGAGWTSVLLDDYWLTGADYDYMAVQLDEGTWPVSVQTATLTQDIPWTEFQCVFPQLTADDYTVINAWGTTDSLWIDTTLVFPLDDEKTEFMDNYEIGIWLRDQYGAGTPFQYKFSIPEPDVAAIFTVFNGYSQINIAVDSIVNFSDHSEVYVTAPYTLVRAGDYTYRTWIMYENLMTFTYATYENAAGATAISNDAIAAYGLLQHIRGVNGEPLSGCAALAGLADQGDYAFEHYSGVDRIKLKGMAAALAYQGTHFRYALYLCQSEGMGLGITADDPDFLVQLMFTIEAMLQ